MIAIAGFEQYRDTIAEFFQLFKTPWEFYKEGENYDVVICDSNISTELPCKVLLIYSDTETIWDKNSDIDRTELDSKSIFYDNYELPFYCRSVFLKGGNALIGCQKSNKAIVTRSTDFRIVYAGYNLFAEVKTILSNGQPLKYAKTPAIDLHISILRTIILQSDIRLVEIPPVPLGYSFFGCLTHDIDFLGIKLHSFDHSFAGFLYRAIPGSIIEFFHKKISVSILLKNLTAAFKLPLVYLGVAPDFWLQFDWYIEHEKSHPSTYFLSPFKNRKGEMVSSKIRAMPYQASEIPDIIDKLLANGDEIGVHGIDAWHSVEKGKEEFNQISSLTGNDSTGIRMHWLCSSPETYKALEQAGYNYDSTCGYNETPGFKAGTFIPFVPPGCTGLLEIPMHIQDCSMFYKSRMNLIEKEAMLLMESFVSQCAKMGGVLTCLWHDRSPAPERNWGDAYIKLINKIKDKGGHFATCKQIAKWFRARRDIKINKISAIENKIIIDLENFKNGSVPPMFLRIYEKNKIISDIPINSNKIEAIIDENIFA
jgi:hypothetical protein